MRQNIKTLQLTKPRRAPCGHFGALPVVLPVFCGLWGLWNAVCPTSVLWLFTGLASAALCACLSWEKRWQRLSLLLLALAGALLCLLFRAALARGLGALLSAVRERLTLQTGYYYPPYENAARNALTDALLSVLAGALTAAAVRLFGGLAHLTCAAGILLLTIFGFLPSSPWLFVYLLGTLLLLVLRRRFGSRAVLCALALLALLSAPALLLARSIALNEAGAALRLHRLRYETADNPMPEGNLQDLPAFRPSQDAALALTMTDWSAVYLRGYIGERYTSQGWQRTLDAQDTQLLYTLQSSGFYPSAQCAAAYRSVAGETDTSFSVHPIGACGAYRYVPYGAEPDAQEPRALLAEGGDGGADATGALFSVADSYLLQARLTDADEDYMAAENAYRQWVYARYLDIPEEDATLLRERFSIPDEKITTAQAQTLVRAWVDATLTYDEGSVARQGDQSFLSYLLNINPRGYSVQYATLATLLLRCCGIPARYVEGYLLPRAEAAETEVGTTVILTQRHSHAWTELYLDGVGWIPFDTTPNHRDEIVYAQGSGTSKPQEEPQPQPPQQTELPDRQPTTKGAAVSLTALWWLPLLLIVLFLLLRCIVLRSRLRRRLRSFAEGEARAASLGALRYTQTMLDSLGLCDRNVPFTQRGEEIAALLGTEVSRVQPVLTLAAALLFSDHDITPEDRAQALGAMRFVRSVWQKKRPPHKRLWERFVRCTIL